MTPRTQRNTINSFQTELEITKALEPEERSKANDNTHYSFNSFHHNLTSTVFDLKAKDMLLPSSYFQAVCIIGNERDIQRARSLKQRPDEDKVRGCTV